MPGFSSDTLHQVELRITTIRTLSIPGVLLGFLISFYAISQLNVHFSGPKAPLLGLRWALESRYFANWRFFCDAASVLNDGYAKVW